MTADKIYKEILNILADGANGDIAYKFNDGNHTTVEVFMSVNGGAGATSLAIAYGKKLAMKGIPTLYLNFETLNSSGIFLEGEGNVGFDEIIYAIKSKKQSVSLKIESNVLQTVEGLDFFNEARIALDMLEMNDDEMREMAKEELAEGKRLEEELSEKLKILLLPKDPNDDKNIMLEVRAGAGGDEAALFAMQLYRMYTHYAESQNWKVEMIDVNENGIGGYKEVVAMVSGKGAYSKLKYESGVHRVQRVPETESGGRIHTSTASVAVMPEAEEVDVQIDMNDVRIDVMRASGNGGQCVNTTDSAVRLTHYPTGIVIYSQTEKSQLQNKEKAFALLRSKLYEIELEKKQSAEAADRRSQIGTGDRSEKIRTYNFPQGRVTDHRINLTLYKLDKIMNGDIQELIDGCIAADQAAKLAKLNEQ